MKIRAIHFLNSIRGTYCQVFFSNTNVLAVFLVLASFTDPCVGISGMMAAVFTLGLGNLFGLNPNYVRNGTYSFNSLLTGFALGAYFKLSGNFLVILFTASSLTLLFSVWMASLSEKHKLPFLSLPFILTLWIILLNARSFENSFLVPRDVIGCTGVISTFLKNFSNRLEVSLPQFFIIYFRSIAAIFFQSHLLAGIIISIGLLLYSRIAFVLSFVGFLAGLFYFRYIQGNLNDQEYSLISFNYILAALGLGGYFLISSGGSFLLVLFVSPILGLVITASQKIIGLYSLPLYSLPFSMVVILVVSLLNNRYFFKYLHLVHFQQFSPEKNLYAFKTFMERFKKNTDVAIHLPFYGEWTVSQGHDGNMTHKEDYRFALDFVVTDEHKRTFKLPGKKVTDFYCYGLPVLSQADGEVVTVLDGIDDNEIGDSNLTENWGNTVIIKHSEYLYSKISHLKKGSFKVKPGETIKKGDVIAACGNSGRSPEPHIHFQLQVSEYIGASTLDHPVSSYATKTNSHFELNFCETPKEGEVVMRPALSQTLKNTFHFVPGMKFNFEVEDGKHIYHETWEVFTDHFNTSYLKCERTDAIAYFASNDALFYFTGFKGDTSSLLYYFYLGAYKIALSDFESLRINDRLSIEGTQKGILKIVQDFIAPFYIFIRPRYSSSVKTVTDNGQNKIQLVSEARPAEYSGSVTNFEIEVYADKIRQIKIIKDNRCIIAKNTQ